MDSITPELWLVIAGVVALVALLVWIARSRRGQRIAIAPEPPTLRPTLAKASAPEPVIAGPDPIAAAVALAVVAPSGDADDLSLMKGVGPKLVAALHALGITRYEQIATWDDTDIARIDPQLGAFKGRIVRDRWIEQAKLLSARDRAGFEAAFGRLDGGAA